MGRFITKSILFLLPLCLLELFTSIFYTNNNGDLLRLGYIFNSNPNYRDIFKDEFKRERSYDKLSDRKKLSNYTILTIGDSFSEQGNFAYQNYVNKDYKILHFDRILHSNAIQTLFSLSNGDFFKQYKFNFIVLQSVERHFVEMSNGIDTTRVINIADIQKKLQAPIKIASRSLHLYSEKVIKFPYYSIQYFIQNDYYFPQVYRAQLSNKLFSVKRQELLFYHLDIDLLKWNNDINEVAKLNDYLNKLANRLNQIGIKLIILPSPDKYDIYYESLLHKHKYLKPIFFEHMDSMKKDYIYINSKKVLSQYLHIQKDLYFYDDTHWSPWSSKLIGQKISSIVEN